MMPSFQPKIQRPVTAVQYTGDVRIRVTHDCGSELMRPGDWLVDGDCLYSMHDDEFRAEFEQVAEVGEREEYLKEAVAKGHG